MSSPTLRPLLFVALATLAACATSQGAPDAAPPLPEDGAAPVYDATPPPDAEPIIDAAPGCVPEVCDDGVTIAKRISLKDPVENLGAQLLRDAAVQTSQAVGDVEIGRKIRALRHDGAARGRRVGCRKRHGGR